MRSSGTSGVSFCAFKLSSRRLPVARRTEGIAWASRSLSPIFEAVRPSRWYFAMSSSTSLEVRVTQSGFAFAGGRFELDFPLPRVWTRAIFSPRGFSGYALLL